MTTETDTYEPAASAGEPSTPMPPLTGLPVERVPGSWAWATEPTARQRDEGYDQAGPGPVLAITPRPLIGAIPFGGIIDQSGQETLATGATIVLGDTGNAQPRKTQIALFCVGGAFGTALQLMPDQGKDNPGTGAFLPLGGAASGLLILNVKRAVVRNVSGGPVVLNYFTIGYES